VRRRVGMAHVEMQPEFHEAEVAEARRLCVCKQRAPVMRADPDIELELQVREDGTAEPRFVYGHGIRGKNVTVRGWPFYLDMTYAAEEAGNDTYLGFDFGTSTSSMCYVDARDIRTYSNRAKDKGWQNISALVDVLPYPAAYPLARFISESITARMEHAARHALEGMLTVISYLAYAEHCCRAGAGRAIFRGKLRQRSAGPLWGLFRQCAESTGARWQFCKVFIPLSSEPLRSEIDAAISAVADIKHDKLGEAVDYPRLLEILGNTICRVLDGKAVGYFEEIRLEPSSMDEFEGLFRVATGPSPTFIRMYSYDGSENFPPEFLFLVDLGSGEALRLFPLFVRRLEQSRAHEREPDLFMYDFSRDEHVEYKAVQLRNPVNVDATQFPGLHKAIMRLFVDDPAVMAITRISLRPRE
jgi:hypothetical protein